MGPNARLKIYTEKLGDIREIIRYLQVLEKAYNHLYVLDFVIQDAKRRHQEMNISVYLSQRKTVKSLISIRKPDEFVLPDDRIQIYSISIKSPGFWEFLGNMNPLEVLRKYLCDRHERMKDKSYRNRQEEERGELENEKLRMEVVEQKVELLKELGVPEEKIRKAFFEHVIKPLGQLDTIQDKGLIIYAEIILDNKQQNP